MNEKKFIKFFLSEGIITKKESRDFCLIFALLALYNNAIVLNKSLILRKNFFLKSVFLLLLSCFIFNGCDIIVEIDDDNRDGLTQDIREFMPNDILQKIEDLGMPIYDGIAPPNITGTFFMSPCILKASNFDEFDAIGYLFDDATIIYSNQDNKNHTIRVFQNNLRDNSVGGNGTGGFIVGKDKNFTVFVKIVDVDTHGHKAIGAMLYSGTMSDLGIRNLHCTTVMIDNGGNPDDNLIENGQSRLLYDSDGLSERISSTKNSEQKMNVSSSESHSMAILKSFWKH